MWKRQSSWQKQRTPAPDSNTHNWPTGFVKITKLMLPTCQAEAEQPPHLSSCLSTLWGLSTVEKKPQWCWRCSFPLPDHSLFFIFCFFQRTHRTDKKHIGLKLQTTPLIAQQPMQRCRSMDGVVFLYNLKVQRITVYMITFGHNSTVLHVANGYIIW